MEIQNDILSMRVQNRWLKTHALIASSLLAFVNAFAAPSTTPIYKSRDAKGNLVYSDQPPSGPAQRVVIQPRPPNAANAAVAEQQRRAKWEATEAARRALAEEASKKQATLSEARAKQCRAARFKDMEFSTNRPHYRLGDRGERIYSTPTEIDVERSKAQAQIAEFCDPSDARAK